MARLSVQSMTPGRVFEDLIIVGSGDDQEYDSAPGDIRAYNVRTGKLAWTFHTIPHEGEFGYETWPEFTEASWKSVGGANCVGGDVVDVAPRDSVCADGESEGTTFMARTGRARSVWRLSAGARCTDGQAAVAFQMVHHDIWDYDNATAPKLMTVRHNGQVVDVVAQAGKTGFLYVFNRVTGEPLWPIEERPVPKSDMPGEEAWPTQPFPTAPPPFARQAFGVKDLSPFY